MPPVRSCPSKPRGAGSSKSWLALWILCSPMTCGSRRSGRPLPIFIRGSRPRAGGTSTTSPRGSPAGRLTAGAARGGSLTHRTRRHCKRLLARFWVVTISMACRCPDSRMWRPCARSRQLSGWRLRSVISASRSSRTDSSITWYDTWLLRWSTSERGNGLRTTWTGSWRDRTTCGLLRQRRPADCTLRASDTGRVGIVPPGCPDCGPCPGPIPRRRPERNHLRMAGF